MAGAMAAGMVHVGVKTGLFRAMADRGAMTRDAVIKSSKLQPRYVEEWLKGMVASGYLAYDPAAQTYTLSEEHAYFLASDDTDHFVGGLFAMVPPLLRVAPQVVKAFAEGGGVPFERLRPGLRQRARPHQSRPVRDPALPTTGSSPCPTPLRAWRPAAARSMSAAARARYARAGEGVSRGGDHRHRSGRGVDPARARDAACPT